MKVHAVDDVGAQVIFARSSSVFTNYFEFIGANDGDLLRESYRARYQVFCVERGFLDPADYPNRQEVDEYDAHAIHVLARHRSGATAGTARLILHSPRGFPCQAHCVFDDAFAYLRDPLSPRLATYSEVSRLVVSKLFRRRARDTFYGGDPRSTAGSSAEGGLRYPALGMQRIGPEIVSGLYKYLFHESKRLGVTHWLIAVEPGLDILLRRMGWPFVPVGPEADYYGPVRPYLAEVADAERALARKNPQFFAFLSEGLYPSAGESLPIRKLQSA